MLIHATVTVSGDQALLGACEVCLRRLLSSQFLKDEVTEHHGPSALCYDLKVEGGIPFPAFVQASQEFAELTFTAEWVSVAAGERGFATLVGGKLTSQKTDAITTAAAAPHPVYVSVGENGRLTLALTLFRATGEEWRGYGLTATRDALLRVLRKPGSSAVELYATEGSPEWKLVWRGDLDSRQFVLETLKAPAAIEDVVYRELERLAQNFVAEWIWFAGGRREEIAIEKERYARYGYETADANVRSSHLHRMKNAAGESGGPFEYSTLGADEQWVKDVVLACWAKES